MDTNKIQGLLPIFLIVFVDVLGYTIIIPLLPFYASSMGASAFVVGLLFSSYAFSQMIAGPILGRISDSRGRKPVLIVSQIGTFIGFIMLALSTNIFAVFFARIVDGFTAGNITVAQAYITDVTTKKNRTRALGFVGAAFGSGFLLGPAISAILSDYGQQYPIWLAAFLSLTSVLMTTFMLPRVPKNKRKMLQSALSRKERMEKYYYLFRKPELKQLFTQYFFFNFSFTLFIAGLALFSERVFTWNGEYFGAKEVGYVFAYAGLIGVFVQIKVLGWVLNFLKERKIIAIGFMGMALGYTLMGFSRELWIFMFVFTLGVFGHALSRPSLLGMISKEANEEDQGLALGLGQSLQAVAQVIAPAISGYLIGISQLSAWGVAAGFFALLGALTPLIFISRGSKPQKA